MPNELTNPNNAVTEERLAEFYQQILPYLGGMPDILANKFSKADLYSTDEKMVGRWIDGKPLYQKTFTGLSKTLSSSWNTIVTIPDIDEVIHLDVKYSDSPKSTIGEIEYGPNHSTNGIEVITTGPSRTINTATLQYTKTTDSAVDIGSDTDYSTTEKIVGTWIDGKPVYQKVISKTVSVSANNTITVEDLSSLNIEIICKVDSTFFASGEGTYIIPEKSNRILVDSSKALKFNATTAWAGTISVILQYTKTSS